MIKEIKINNLTNKVIMKKEDRFLGVKGENKYETLKFVFEDIFLNGEGILEIQKPNSQKEYIILEKEEDCYLLEVKNSLLSLEGEIIMQLVVRMTDNIVFKSTEFSMQVLKAIEATTEIPDEYETWDSTLAAKILEIDSKLEEVTALEEDLEDKVESGYFKGEKGDTGDKGDTGAKGDPFTYEDFTEEQLAGLKGQKGDPGTNGSNGADGKSAYQIWLDEGNSGTEQDFLNSLKGEDADTQEIESELSYLREENTRLKNDLNATTLSVSATGENNTLENTAEARFKKFEIQGNSKQEVGNIIENETIIGEIPSIEYPSEIKNVTGNVEIVVQNKNLFNINDFAQKISSEFNVTEQNGEVTLNRISNTTYRYTLNCEENTVYTIQLKLKNSTNDYYVQIRYDDNTSKNIYSQNATSNYVSVTKISDSNKTIKYLEIQLYGWNNQLSLKDIQLEKGTVATSYTLCKEQKFIFPLGNEKLMLGDYLADDGIHHVRGQAVYDGDEAIFANTNSGNIYAYILPTTNKARNTTVLSNYFKQISTYNGGIGIFSVSNINVCIDNISSVSEFKSWLSTHNLLVEYGLEEEVVVPYTAEQQAVYNQIKNTIKSYSGETNIYSTNEVSPIFDVEAYADTKLILNEKANTGDIPDISNFITNAVNDLINYYLKSETYTRTEVNNLIGQIATLQFAVVNQLPVTGDNQHIYLVPSSNPEVQNVKDEYLWVNNVWEKIGSTQINLNGYATETWVNTQIANFLTESEIQTFITNALDGKEDKTNKVISISNLSTDDEYPSAKCVYNNEKVLDERISELENNTDHVYGIKRKITNNSSPSWERILDSVGRFANATKDGENAQNDFDSLAPWSEIKSCNYDLTTKEINAWFGDPNFKFDGTNGDVFTYIPKTYWKIYQEDDYEYVLLADYPKEGFTEINSFFVGRYDCTDIGGKLRTYSGLVPTTNRTVTTFRNSANALGSKFSQLDWRYFVLQMLYLVEYATYDSQTALGNGIMSRNLVNTLIAENGTNRVVVTNNTNFYIGQIIRIGTSANGGQIGLDRIITAVEEYDDGTVTGSSLTFSGTPVNIAVGNYVSTCAQQTGQCDILGMKSGCLNNDGYHSVIYRGMENIYGDVFKFVDGINIRDSQVYICKDHSQYQTDLFELPYKPLSYINYPTANGWAKTLGFDINEPFFRFPTEVGGSSSTYLCDYYVKGTGSVNFRIGGCSTDERKNGFWSFYTSGSTAGASWDRACRILIDS